MVVPRFLRFYPGYTMGSLLNEYALVFYSLVNSMRRLEAEESLSNINNQMIANSEKPKEHIDKLQEASEGISAIVKQARIIKGIQK